MASNADFVQYIADQCAGAGEIVAKKMFGDYGIYCNGKIFGLICDDCFYLKPTEAGRKLLRTVDMRPPYEGAKDYFYIISSRRRTRNCRNRNLRKRNERLPGQDDRRAGTDFSR